MPLVTAELWALRNDAGQSFPDVSVGTGRPIVDCRAWGAHALRIQFGDGTTPLTAREVANGFQFDMTARRRLTFQRRTSLTFPGDEIWTPENGMTYVEFLLDDLPGVGDVDGDNYVFPLTLELPADVLLFYQPALTAEEIANGSYRPDWCVGSFAVYHVDGRKLGHIPRPFLTDDNGTKIWGGFQRVGGVLAKVFRKTAVDALTPPLIIDDTFGYGSAPGSYQTCGDDYWFGTFIGSPASNGTLDALTIYTYSGNHLTAEGGIYDDNGSDYPNNLIDWDSTGIDVYGAAGWRDPFSLNSVAISTATIYHAVVGIAEETGLTFRWYYDTDSHSIWRQAGETTNPPPDPYAAGATEVKSSAIVGAYATYTPSGGGFAGASRVLGGNII